MLMFRVVLGLGLLIKLTYYTGKVQREISCGDSVDSETQGNIL